MKWIKNPIAFGAMVFMVAILTMGIIFAFLYRHEIAGNLATASAKRALAKHVVTTVDLSGHYLTPSAVFSNPNSYWGNVPNGFQIFHGVPFQIGGLLYLWGKGNSDAGAEFPEEVLGIPMNQKFETLYVYHGAFFSAPDGTPVSEIVFRYQDGSSATNQLLYGADVLDFVIGNSNHKNGPTAARSKRVWTGATFTQGKNDPLQFIVTAVENPHSKLEVTTIDLYSCKSRSASCILAMTAGRAGMMK